MILFLVDNTFFVIRISIKYDEVSSPHHPVASKLDGPLNLLNEKMKNSFLEETIFNSVKAANIFEVLRVQIL